MDIRDRQALRGKAIDHRTRDLLRFVGGVIQDLHVQQLARIVEARNRFDQPFDDVAFVKNGQLNRDARPRSGHRRRARNILRIRVVVVDQPITVQTVNRKDKQHDEVRNHHRQVEKIGVVDPGERLVRQFVPVLADGSGVRGKQHQHRKMRVQDEGLESVTPLSATPSIIR